MTAHGLIAFPVDDRYTGQCDCGWVLMGATSLDEIAIFHGNHLNDISRRSETP